MSTPEQSALLWSQRKYLGDSKRSQELALFLPAALEIQETPPNPIAKWLVRCLIGLVVIAITWAYFGEVNIVASAEGKIIPGSRIKQIQPLNNSIVKNIMVREGDFVTRGQALVELDETLTLADQQGLQQEMENIGIDLAVNRALVKQVALPDKKQALISYDSIGADLGDLGDAHFSQLAHRLLWEQWQLYRNQMFSLESSVDGIAAERRTLMAVIQKFEKLLPIVSKRADTTRDLNQKGYIAELDYLNIEQERIQLEQDLVAERHRLEQLGANLADARFRVENLKAESKTRIITEVLEQERRIEVLQKELVKAAEINQRQILYAPVDGKVQELAINTVGGVVTEAQQLMLVVPKEEQLELEVLLENKDIGFVEEGMQAEVKIHTFPFTKYGIVDAVVTNISDDAVIDEKRGLLFKMQLRMLRDWIDIDGKRVSLKPGMSVTVEMQTGERRVIEFFLAPLLRYQQESIRER
ncbi:MAG: HlyD family type I secretion periplasmic adaptor subunit [Gammaproteobacteria bacterium]|nr:HlyD family type I secretion periplasmic adaptor subunit [Gammaproteobacteria bacterium]